MSLGPCAREDAMASGRVIGGAARSCAWAEWTARTHRATSVVRPSRSPVMVANDRDGASVTHEYSELCAPDGTTAEHEPVDAIARVRLVEAHRLLTGERADRRAHDDV